MLTTKQGQQDQQPDFLNPYQMFTFSIRSELTRKYYERRLRKFFDHIQFYSNLTLEERCNAFASMAKSDLSWTLNQIIKFLFYEKSRVEKGEITGATLRNFLKSIKIFCEMADIPIPWKKITRGLPLGRNASNDRAPNIEELKKLIGYPDRRIKPIVFMK